MRIDGSHGEGGGQILRSSIALSCILGEEVEIVNIRKNRKNPGIKNQHLHGIKLAAQICDAQVEGLKIGATSIKFRPGKIKGGKYKVDVGTAGSISLILQTALPIMLLSPEIEIEIRGGTDVPFSPPIDYYLHVLFPLLRYAGAEIGGEVIERGYYPQGGGIVRVHSIANEMRKIVIDERGEKREKEAYFNLRNLPEHIVKRAKKILEDFEFIADVRNSGISRGCGIVLVSKYEKTIIGGDSLCKRGVPTEKVVKRALENLSFEEKSIATVDRHMADHLPIFSALTKEVKYRVSELTEHAKTNLWVLEQFGGKTKIKGEEIHAYM